MSETRWTAVDRYFEDLLVAPDAALAAAIEASREAGLPPHEVSPSQGKLLQLVARMTGARRILEIGTLGGYSTIWLARALPAGGRLITLEASEKHAEVARENIARAGLDQVVEVRVGPALASLAELPTVASFDLIFLDADKPNNPLYLAEALRLSRPGTVIVADNVVRDGALIDARSEDPSVIGVRRFADLVAAEPRLDATAIQTVGQKGWDGFVLALVRD